MEASFTEHWTWMHDGIYRYFISMGDILRNTISSIDTKPVTDNIQRFFNVSHMEWDPQLFTVFASAFAGMLGPILVIYAICSCVRGRKRQDILIQAQNESLCFSSAGTQLEALRWFKQGRLDKEAARHDMYTSRPAFEWVCFKCQQAAEKCIKAAVLLKRGARASGDNVSDWGHNLPELSRPLRDRHVTKLATELQGIVGIVGRMRYPDSLPYPQVPRDAYSRNQACAALKTSGLIIQHIEEMYIDNR